jgi:hypothetical protein
MPAGHMKLVLLHPGDSFTMCNGTKRPTLCTVPYTRYLYRHIMRPGFPVVHVALTSDDCWMIGGMIWPRNDLYKLVTSLKYIMGNPAVAEHIPQRLPKFIDALLNLGSRKSSDPTFLMKEHDIDAVKVLKEESYLVYRACARTRYVTRSVP